MIRILMSSLLKPAKHLHVIKDQHALKDDCIAPTPDTNSMEVLDLKIYSSAIYVATHF